MKKSVLTILTAFAVSSFGSMVFAADVQEAPVVHGNVEVYGQARLSVDMIDTDSKTADADTKLTRVSSNSSRLGFKGKEDLGDGLSAVYQVELGVVFDGSVSTVSFRNTYGGLNSKSLGTLIFGIHDTPYKLATGGLDIFGDTMGDYNAIIGNVNGAANFDLRTQDAIHYQSPTWGGFHFRAATSTKGTETSNGAVADPSGYSASAVYSSATLYAALAYESHKNNFATWDLGTTITGTKAGVGYTFGDTKIGLVYEALKDDLSNSQYTRNALYLALSHKLGNETIKLAYGSADDGDNPATETGATQITAGIDHALSKRTTIYALYSKMKNDANATYSMGVGVAPIPGVGAGEDPSAVSIGINHSF